MTLKIHVHAAGRVATVNLGPKTLRQRYTDLAGALLASLARHSTKDDAQPGHPFYGNQYTDVVLGPKPTEAKVKGVKNAVHELLSSGHVFSLEELKAATGAKLDQQLLNAINELKAGKHASGALGINKVGKGLYQVVKPNGEPAKGLEAPAALVDDLVKGAQEAAKKADPPSPPAQAEEIAPTPAPAAPGGGWKDVAVAPATKMSKEQADLAYKAQLLEVHKEVVSLGFDAALDPKELAQAWKEGKAKAMAQWSANITGIDHKPKLVSVFPEDIALVNKLVDAHENTFGPAGFELASMKAMEEWKKDTKAAKYPAPEPEAKPPDPKPETKAEETKQATPSALHGPLSFPVPEKLVPHDHKGIEPSDFSSGEYAKGINSAHAKLHAAASDSVANKVTIQKALEAKLKTSPHFQNMREQFAKKGGSYGGSLEASIISMWASSSGDHHDRAVSAQLAIRDAFKMNNDDVEYKQLGSLHDTHKGNEENVHRAAAKEMGIDVSTPEKLESYKKGMQDFALAQYHHTQERFAELGIKELHLVRGMKFGDGNAKATSVDLKLQPASSFTTKHSTAVGFAGGHSLFAVKVPVSQILGSFVTGYGCTNESEVVVLAHEGLQAVKVGTKNAPNTNTMAEHVHAELNSGAVKATKPKKAKVPTEMPTKPVTNKWSNKVEELAKAGDLEGLDAHIKHMQASGAKLPKSIKYGKETLAYLTAHQAPKPAPAAAKPTTAAEHLAQVPGEGQMAKSHNFTAMAQELAHKKDLAGLKALMNEAMAVPGGTGALSYIQEVHNWVSKQPQQSTPTTIHAGVATPPAPPAAPLKLDPKKNAHYYKKLKEKLLAHPMHSEITYNALKAAGMSHEKILSQYEKMVNQYNEGVPA